METETKSIKEQIETSIFQIKTELAFIYLDSYSGKITTEQAHEKAKKLKEKLNIYLDIYNKAVKNEK